MSRIIVFLSILILFILLVAGVYFFVLRDIEPEQPSGDPSFGPGGEPVTRPGDENGFVIDNGETQIQGILVQIHDDPVAGAYVYTPEPSTEEATTTAITSDPLVQFVDRQTGHVFSYNTEEARKNRISNTTFPGIQEVRWFSDPNRLALRYTNSDNEIETYLGEISEGSLSGSYLEIDIPAVDTFENSVLSISTSDRGSDLFIADADGTNAELTLEVPFTSIVIPAFSEEFIAVLTRPVSSLPGALYLYESGIQDRIVGGVPGLSALPNNEGTRVIWSESTDRGFQTYIHNRDIRETRPLPIATLPEKCVWGGETVLYCMVPNVIPPARYPEHWYQGIISFTDTLWRIDTEVGVARVLAFFDEVGPFDGSLLAVDENEEYLTFVNRRDGTLWGFDL